MNPAQEEDSPCKREACAIQRCMRQKMTAAAATTTSDPVKECRHLYDAYYKCENRVRRQREKEAANRC
jgi:hypothetical protein